LQKIGGILPAVYACNDGVFAFKFPFFKREWYFTGNMSHNGVFVFNSPFAKARLLRRYRSSQ